MAIMVTEADVCPSRRFACGVLYAPTIATWCSGLRNPASVTRRFWPRRQPLSRRRMRVSQVTGKGDGPVAGNAVVHRADLSIRGARGTRRRPWGAERPESMSLEGIPAREAQPTALRGRAMPGSGHTDSVPVAAGPHRDAGQLDAQ